MTRLRKHHRKHMNPEPKESTNSSFLSGDQDSTSKNFLHFLGKHKWLTLIGLAVVLILMGEFFLILKSRVTPPEELTPAATPTLTQTPLNEAKVMITDKGFTPATLMVKVGTLVNWLSQDKKLHQIASDPHPLHNLLPGFFQNQPSLSFTFTFTKAGTFTYHDEKNPLKSKGTIIVR